MNTDNEKLGILIYIITLLSFAAMEALAKNLSGAFTVSQIVWARYTFHFLIIIIVVMSLELLGYKSGLKFPKLIKTQILRSISLLLMTYCFFTSLSKLSLAEATIILFVSPLITTILAPLILKEKVTSTSWVAVLIGFVGMVIVIGPSNIIGFSTIDMYWLSGILYGIAGALFYSLYQIGTRVLATVEPALTSLLFSGAAGLLGTTFLVLINYDPASGMQAWKAPNIIEWCFLITVGLFGAIGQFLILGAYAKAKAITLAPISYTHIIWATLFGYFFFSSIPEIQTCLGAILIVGSGIYTFNKIEYKKYINK